MTIAIPEIGGMPSPITSCQLTNRVRTEPESIVALARVDVGNVMALLDALDDIDPIKARALRLEIRARLTDDLEILAS